MPKATVKTAPLLTDIIDAAPGVVVPLVLPPLVEPEVPLTSLPPMAWVETGAVLLEAFLAAAANASMVLGPDLLGGC